MNIFCLICLFSIVGGASYRFVRSIEKRYAPIRILWFGFEIIALVYLLQHLS